MTEAQVYELAHGTLEYNHGSFRVPHKLNKSEWAAFNKAKERGYVTVRGERPNLGNVWWLLCEAQERPYVKVQKRRKYAAVWLDMLTAPYDLLAENAEKIKGFLGEVTIRGATLHWRAVTAGTYRIPVDSADEVAAKLLEIACDDDNKKEVRYERPQA